MTKLLSISKLLTAAGIANTTKPSTMSQEDDEIEITETVSVQIGNGYMSIVEQASDGCMVFTDTKKSTLVANLKKVLAQVIVNTPDVVATNS